MQARLPLDKIERITLCISNILSRKSCTRKELEQLLGHLNFATRVILPGRSFVSYLYKLMSSVKEGYYHIHLNKECKADLYMWLEFLSNWNGISMFYDACKVTSDSIQLFTDASSTIGYGGYFEGHWFCDRWPVDLPRIVNDTLSMAFLELYPIVVASILWGKQWSGKRIVFNCDNQATVQIITKGRSKEPFISFADGSFQEAGTRSRSSVYAVSSFNGSDLDSVVENLWDHSISIRTRNQYKVGLDCYIKFTLLRGLHGSVSDLPPISEQLLIYFVAFCDEHLRLAYSTIKLYLSGIRYFYLRLKGCNPFQNNAGQNLICLQSVLTGVKKKQSMYAVPKRSRLPITMSILTKMCQLLRSGIFDMFTSYMFEAACTVAFFGFLRCGEFTVLSDSHYDDYVSIQDVICHDSFVALTLRKSKTDPFRNGVQIKLFKTQTDVCPVNAVVKYLKLRSEVFKSQPLPFFVTKEGSILTRAIFIDTLKVILSQLGLNSDLYNGHSFRIGAATTAQEARIEDHLIKTLGRWSSNCYTTYIHTSPSVIQNAQQQIASSVL
ncbi:uncharacterized protein LOC134254037 [Saccostrea cucullata]|uniref:uncharacterized protein LOC134254037 n=1 Tax=Saccostrea cuccullata TaxID=36930 RepID=UPI002ED5CC86